MRQKKWLIVYQENNSKLPARGRFLILYLQSAWAAITATKLSSTADQVCTLKEKVLSYSTEQLQLWDICEFLQVNCFHKLFYLIKVTDLTRLLQNFYFSSLVQVSIYCLIPFYLGFTNFQAPCISLIASLESEYISNLNNFDLLNLDFFLRNCRLLVELCLSWYFWFNILPWTCWSVLHLL